MLYVPWSAGGHIYCISPSTKDQKETPKHDERDHWEVAVGPGRKGGREGGAELINNQVSSSY